MSVAAGHYSNMYTNASYEELPERARSMRARRSVTEYWKMRGLWSGIVAGVTRRTHDG